MKEKITRGKLHDLIQDDRNLNKGTERGQQLIEKSLREFGAGRSILLDKNNRIIAGNKTHANAEAVGMDDVIIVETDGTQLVAVKRTDVDLDTKKGREMALADNATGKANLEWDVDELESVAEDFGIAPDDWDVEMLEEEETPKEVIEDDFDEDTDDVETRCKNGDVWLLGNHRLMCGDSTDEECVAKLMDGNRADIAFTSPPYNAGTTPTEVKMGKTTKYDGKDDNKQEKEYTLFLDDYLKNSIGYSEFSFMNIQSLSNNKRSIIDLMFRFRDKYADTIIWDKTASQPAMAENVLNSEFEYVHIFSENATRAIGTIKFRGTIPNILHLSVQRNNEFSKIHNATFSVEFVSFFIKNFAKKSVLDLFGGTGTTLIAAEQLNRKCYMMELDPHYCDVILARWEKLTGKTAEKVGG